MKASWRTKLESLLGMPVETVTVLPYEQNTTERIGLPPGDVPHSGQSIELPDGSIRFIAHTNEDTVVYFDMKPGVLTAREERLIGQLLQEWQRSAEAFGAAGHAEGCEMRRLGEWIQEQLGAGRLQAVVTDECNAGGRLNDEAIPFLLVTDHAAHAHDGELEKLLQSYLDEDIMLVPLRQQEWLVLAPDSLLHEDNGGRDDEEETPEEVLESIARGMNDMLANEWIGESHIAVSHPIVPAVSVVETVSLLRETVSLGRKFHQGNTVHLPWNVHLERLLNSIPEEQRNRYMEQVVNRTDLLLEPEIITTLETFFAMNCNVSDTAKQLFIHRNTLLYRLDKLKQDTGLDVRLFRDAVLVKIILLLYKVTKRK